MVIQKLNDIMLKSQEWAPIKNIYEQKIMATSLASLINLNLNLSKYHA